MKRKLIAVMLTAALTVSLLTGCGSDAATDQQTAGTQTENTAASSADATDTAPAAVADEVAVTPSVSDTADTMGDFTVPVSNDAFANLKVQKTNYVDKTAIPNNVTILNSFYEDLLFVDQAGEAVYFGSTYDLFSPDLLEDNYALSSSTVCGVIDGLLIVYYCDWNDDYTYKLSALDLAEQTLTEIDTIPICPDTVSVYGETIYVDYSDYDYETYDYTYHEQAYYLTDRDSVSFESWPTGGQMLISFDNSVYHYLPSVSYGKQMTHGEAAEICNGMVTTDTENYYFLTVEGEITQVFDDYNYSSVAGYDDSYVVLTQYATDYSYADVYVYNLTTGSCTKVLTLGGSPLTYKDHIIYYSITNADDSVSVYGYDVETGVDQKFYTAPANPGIDDIYPGTSYFSVVNGNVYFGGISGNHATWLCYRADKDEVVDLDTVLTTYDFLNYGSVSTIRDDRYCDLCGNLIGTFSYELFQFDGTDAVSVSMNRDLKTHAEKMHNAYVNTLYFTENKENCAEYHQDGTPISGTTEYEFEYLYFFNEHYADVSLYHYYSNYFNTYEYDSTYSHLSFDTTTGERLRISQFYKGSTDDFAQLVANAAYNLFNEYYGDMGYGDGQDDYYDDEYSYDGDYVDDYSIAEEFDDEEYTYDYDYSYDGEYDYDDGYDYYYSPFSCDDADKIYDTFYYAATLNDDAVYFSDYGVYYVFSFNEVSSVCSSSIEIFVPYEDLGFTLN